jgi:class 3 adenylate cyclase
MDERPATHYAVAPDGASLAYHVVGDGPLDVVWMPSGSFPFDLLWDEPGFAHLVRRLAAFSRTIWVTPRGFGASGGDPHDTYRDRAVLEGDLLAVIDDAKCEQACVVGPGVGGHYAISLALAHPDRVTHLVLLNSFAHYIREPGYPIGAPKELLDGFADFLTNTWGSGASAEFMAPSKLNDLGFRERWARIERLGQPPAEGAQTFLMAIGVDDRPMLPELDIPTLVLHRAENRFIQVEAGRYLAEHIVGAHYVELPGADDLYFVGDVDALVDEVEEFITGVHPSPEGDTVTATVMFTDIVGSTEQAARLGHRKWRRLVEEHDAMVRTTLQRYHGHEVATTGDGFLATFDSTTRGVRAATEIVRSAHHLGVEVRAGVHTGDIEVRPDDIHGLAVNIARRACDRAGSGQVFVTEVVRLQLTGSNLTFTEQRSRSLRGVPGTWKVWAVKD